MIDLKRKYFYLGIEGLMVNNIVPFIVFQETKHLVLVSSFDYVIQIHKIVWLEMEVSDFVVGNGRIEVIIMGSTWVYVHGFKFKFHSNHRGKSHKITQIMIRTNAKDGWQNHLRGEHQMVKVEEKVDCLGLKDECDIWRKEAIEKGKSLWNARMVIH